MSHVTKAPKSGEPGYTEYRRRLDQEWRERLRNNPEAYAAYRRRRTEANRLYLQRARKVDPQLVMAGRLRARMGKVLRKAGANKAGHTFEMLGCSRDEFRAYLESKFAPGMSWENREKWHIDHILPVSAFDLTKPEEQHRCFHFTNLQPLWAADNIAKGSTL